MADDKLKTIIEATLDPESSEKLTQEIKDSVSKGFEGKDKEFNNIFNFKNIKKDLGDALNKAWGNSSKVQKRQSAAMDKYSKAQSVVTGLVNKQNKGFGGTAKLVAAIGKQGIAGAAGMAANINPYVLGMKAAAMAAKFTADQFVRIAKESAKFVGQGSLFTDRETITMMQRTGQTGTQAQGTQRALGDLGLTFEDIQSGKITAEQAAAFEQIRQRELEKLEEINAVAAPMFKSMQQVSLGFTLLLRDINDFITMAFARSSGMEQLVGSIKTFISNAAPFMKGLIDTIMPLVGIINSIIALVMDIVSGIMDAIQPIWQGLSPVLEAVDTFAAVLKQTLSPIILFVTGLIKMVVQVIMVVIEPVIKIFRVLKEAFILFQEKALNPMAEALSSVMEFIGNLINNVISGLQSIPFFGELFSDIQPVDFGTTASSITNSGSTYNNQTTNNYVYGSNSMSQASTSPSDLFSNSYVLVND